MKFIDEASVTVQSGNGGRGCVSFRREKFIERGGPDGGDGGDGGNVILKATTASRTLQEFRYTQLIKAENGGHGQGQQKYGRKGKDRVVALPVGTQVYDAETGELIKDFTRTDETLVIARGGRGGQGNKKFATSTHRAPRFAQPGEPGEMFQLRLELKLLADVGIIGFPNAGKSTLIRRLSAAKPKIGNYPFTTLTPMIGMVENNFGEPFAVADIPGLIEGAHDGVGLGIRFLKHVERTGLLLHLIDASAISPDDPLSQYRIINAELAAFSPELPKKKQLIVLNKMDLPEAENLADQFCAALGPTDVLRISAATASGIPKLKNRLTRAVDAYHEHRKNNTV
ncbi:MAG: GTPase ObgE [Deltaproteobacteria bacterium]|nr:MAG: GTPase ObgE [Deltaproteobacteria bacterium]